MPSELQTQRRSREVTLSSTGWTPSTRRQLERLIRAGSGRGLPVAMDFDNTIVWGDIGEATLAVLTRRGLVTPDRVQGVFSPAVWRENRRPVTPESPPDITEYYEALLAPTVHGPRDPTPLASGYVWAVEAMAGLRPLDVVRATEEAYGCSAPMQNRKIEVTPGHTAYPAPFFYPAMVELIALLLQHEFAFWIVSASNVWSVRWMVRHALEPQLRQLGVRRGIPPEQVLGVSVLLADGRGRLHKDACLVRENAGYAALDPRVLGRFRLTGQLQFPVPTYSGKVGCLWDALGGPPFLAAGDSPGDHAMLSFARNRLWIARLDKPEYQAATAKRIRQTGRRGWILQPVIPREIPGLPAELVGRDSKRRPAGERRSAWRAGLRLAGVAARRKDGTRAGSPRLCCADVPASSALGEAAPPSLRSSLTGRVGGFIADPRALQQLSPALRAKVRRSVRLLT